MINQISTSIFIAREDDIEDILEVSIEVVLVVSTAALEVFLA